jgi:hypothetical protein
VLAGIAEAFQAPGESGFEEEMNAIDSLLNGLIDYAGIYPPAGLVIPTAVQNYLAYSRGKHSAVLGRLVVDLNRLSEIREAAGDSLCDIRLSVIAPPASDWEGVQRLLDHGFRIEMAEVKVGCVAEIEYVCKRLSPAIVVYFEIPIASGSELVEAIATYSACAKLRMGGLVAEAFPAALEVAKSLKALANRSVPFKATAGLHHPIRSFHQFSYASDSDSGKMHGFMNLCCASTLLHFGGEIRDAETLLLEEDPAAWKVTDESISWRSFRWTGDQLRIVREKFLISIGSCSFEEPIHDLEEQGWH